MALHHRAHTPKLVGDSPVISMSKSSLNFLFIDLLVKARPNFFTKLTPRTWRNMTKNKMIQHRHLYIHTVAPVYIYI